jgi:hypothetical protein
MSEQALAFGLMALFLFFVALTVSGLDVGTCRQCEHCQDLRRREEQRREAIRMELDARYRPAPNGPTSWLGGMPRCASSGSA